MRKFNYLVLIISIIFLTACGGSGESVVDSDSAIKGNWDSLVWDQGVWM